MEYALLLRLQQSYERESKTVLILVLMEYALLQKLKQLKMLPHQCLNPCSNGICSLTVVQRFNERL